MIYDAVEMIHLGLLFLLQQESIQIEVMHRKLDGSRDLLTKSVTLRSVGDVLETLQMKHQVSGKSAYLDRFDRIAPVFALVAEPLVLRRQFFWFSESLKTLVKCKRGSVGFLEELLLNFP